MGPIRRSRGAWDVSRSGAGSDGSDGNRDPGNFAWYCPETRPDVLVVIDALAARSVRRLNKTIQITNTGIAPGAGVGNRRFGIDAEAMGIPVIAIGIPTVIDAATIVNDTVGNLLTIMDETQNRLSERIREGVASFDEQERYQLVRELMAPEMMNMFVTPKNIDEIVRQMSYTLSEALNSICHSMV